MLIHHCQMVLENNPDWVVIKTDISNVFNSVDRSALFKTVSESFACHVERMYGRSNLLIFLKGHEAITLSSQQGVHQGDPLGPVLTLSYSLSP